MMRSNPSGDGGVRPPAACVVTWPKPQKELQPDMFVPQSAASLFTLQSLLDFHARAHLEVTCRYFFFLIIFDFFIVNDSKF